MTAHSSITGERPTLSDVEFTAVRDFVAGMTGISIDQTRHAMVEARLAKRLRSGGFASVADYLSYLKSDTDVVEKNRFIATMTTNMTRFNREGKHFEIFSSLLKDLNGTNSDRNCPIRVWSAGCSTGEEAYELAFQAVHQFGDDARNRCRVLASDIDPVVLSRAKSGKYARAHASSIHRGEPEAFFDFSGDEAVVKSEIRKLVVFRRVNLVKDWSIASTFDAIFCRNVAIYFDAETQKQLWTKLLQQLSPGGRLFIGHSENIPTEILNDVQQVEVGVFHKSRNPKAAPDNKSEEQSL